MYGSGRFRISYRSGRKLDKGRAHIEDAEEKADIASLYSPDVSIFYFLFAFFARLLPMNWMSWTTTIRTRMVATMTSAWKRW